MWFTILDGYQELRIQLSYKDIAVIHAGYDPEENDGCHACITTKTGENYWILESEKEIDKIVAEERRRDLFFLHQ